jgi:hypothetical protein
MNRRVEVKVLVNRGVVAGVGRTETSVATLPDTDTSHRSGRRQNRLLARGSEMCIDIAATEPRL